MPLSMPVHAETVVQGNLLFQGLSAAGLASVIDTMELRSMAAGQDIITQVCMGGWMG